MQAMSTPEADLTLATALHQRILELDAIKSDDAKDDAKDLVRNLSALAACHKVLWLGGDEGRSLYRLRRIGKHRYGKATTVKLKDFGLAGDKEDGESDIEGLACDGERLWLVGSHSLRRRTHDTKKGTPLSLHEEQSRNAHVLGYLRLDGDGQPKAGQRLIFNAAAGHDALTQALAADPRIAPFLAIPSKDNGLDIEGLTARGKRVLVGLRGPVLRGIALVLDLRLAGFGSGPTLTLADLRYRYLQLSGLAVRDLAVVPDSDDVLILAGPTMTLAGPCYLYRWRNALGKSQGERTDITVEKPEPLLWIRDGRPGRPDRPGRPGDGGDNKPEGLEVQRYDDGLVAWVAYDDPTLARQKGEGDQEIQHARTRLDGFLVPD